MAWRNRARRSAIVAAIVGAVTAFGAGPAWGNEVVWVAADGEAGSWSDPANWSIGAVPTVGDDVVLPDGTWISEIPATVAIRSLRTSAGSDHVAIVDQTADAQIELAAPSRIEGFVMEGVHLRTSAALTVARGAIYAGGLEALAGLHVDDHGLELNEAALVVAGALTGRERELRLSGTGAYVQRAGAVDRPIRVDGLPTTIDGDVRFAGAASFEAPVRVLDGEVGFGAEASFVRLDVTGGDVALTDAYVGGSSVTGGRLEATSSRFEALDVSGDSTVALRSGHVMDGIAVSGARAEVELGGADRDHGTYVTGPLAAQDRGVISIVGHVTWLPPATGAQAGQLRLAANARLWVESDLQAGDGFSIAGGAGSAMVVASGVLTLDAGEGGSIALDTAVINEVLVRAVSGSTTMRALESAGMLGVGRARVTAERLLLDAGSYTFFEIGEGDTQLRATGRATLNGPIGVYLDPAYTTPPTSARSISLLRWGSLDGPLAGVGVSAVGHPLADLVGEPHVISDTLLVTIRDRVDTPPVPAIPIPDPVGPPPFVAPPGDPLPRTPTKVTPLGPLRVLGTRANDVISGSRRGDTLLGGAGNDVIRGGGGDDRIVGGPGRDKLAGDSGNDRIDARDGKAGDTVSCGSGRDTVTADPKDKVAKDCEKVIRK